MELFRPLFQALNEAGIRYVVVGGLATVLHGYPRMTVDVDLITAPAPQEERRMVECLLGLGYRPDVPVDPYLLADPSYRQMWAEEKHMRVFPFWDPENPLKRVDLFLESPVPFEELWRDSKTVSIRGYSIRVASIHHLIEMKRQAGRPQDHDDIEVLQRIQDLMKELP